MSCLGRRPTHKQSERTKGGCTPAAPRHSCVLGSSSNGWTKLTNVHPVTVVLSTSPNKHSPIRCHFPIDVLQILFELDTGTWVQHCEWNLVVGLASKNLYIFTRRVTYQCSEGSFLTEVVNKNENQKQRTGFYASWRHDSQCTRIKSGHALQ